MEIAIAQHALIVGFFLSLALALVVLRYVDRNTTKSLSAHIATRKNMVWLARLLIIAIAILVLVWYLNWYAHVHVISVFQTASIIIVCILAMLVGVFPFYEDKMAGKIHNLLAWAYAYILPFSMLSFIYSSTHILTKIIIIACVAWQLLGVVLHLSKYHFLRTYFLYFQLSYIAVFGIVLITATYIG